MKNTLLIIIITLFALSAKGQDIHFSQFYANPMYIAPSFAGSQGLRFAGNFRDQWSKIPGSYRSFAFSADNYFADFNSGIGLQVMSDNAGSGKMVTTHISLAYSYKVKIHNKFYFQPGLSVQYKNRTIDVSSLDFADEFLQGEFNGNTSETAIVEKYQNFDFAISGLGYIDNLWFGFNVDHLMNISSEIRDDYRYADLRTSLYGGYKKELTKKRLGSSEEAIYTAFNFRNQAGLNQLDLGLYYNRSQIIIGLWYRGLPIVNEYATSDALVYLLGVRFLDYTFSYSYDMSIGKLISYSGGSHEISIIYKVDLTKGKKGKYTRAKSIPSPAM